MTAIEDTTPYARRPGLNAVGMDGEVVMMGMDQGEYYGLRDVAASIWTHLDEPKTVNQLCDLVAAEYAVTPQDCRADIVAFLDEMLDKKLIEAA